MHDQQGKAKKKHGFVASDVHPDRTTKFKKGSLPEQMEEKTTAW